MESLKIHDKKFSESIHSKKIQGTVGKIAAQLNHDLKDKEVVFIGVLNGAFMFASDLMKQIQLNCRISFIKVSSYAGISSTGSVINLIGLNEVIKGKTVVIIEDIIDSGKTLNFILSALKEHEPTEIKIVTLLFKPAAFKFNYKPDYVGYRIPNQFVVGYGLDYAGFGRNLTSIYTLVNE
jgi:hypoxanthine phosphoribosyltransferase